MLISKSCSPPILTLFHVRRHLATPLAWVMVLTMLWLLSLHLAEGMALCIGETHVGIEAAGAAHHADTSEEQPRLMQSSPADRAPEAPLVSASMPERSSHGDDFGSNVQQPLAAAVLGGLVTSMLLVLPLVYPWLAKESVKPVATRGAGLPWSKRSR